MEKVKFFYIVLLLSFLIPFSKVDSNIPTGEDYITGQDGIKRIYVNIWGHVKFPGTYLVYKDIDLNTLLSMAGGPLDGADMSNIKIISKNNKIDTINFNHLIKSHSRFDYDFKPYDTINISPSLNFYLRDNAYILNVILQLITLGITLNNN
ncbi:MAG: hypothetical protein CMG59_06275 [Candidatus Marinimicrobia bacterium]|nr:hypothetical protein [Candidatus Neomarinimicrobiota bacterium]|tara:strand:+ start:855 stop:1307 length:453 start_codon:yes stop_codon:yes gene_type:complete